MAGPIIKATLSGDGSGYQLMMKQAQGAARSLKNEVGGELKNRLAGLFALGAIEEGVRRTIDYADKISDMSQRVGETTDMLQKMDYAASQSGTSLESFASAIEKVNVAREKALSGDKAMTENFKRLGVDSEQLRTMRAGALMTGPIAQTLRTKDQQTLESPIRATMGRGSGALVQALKEFEETSKQIQDMGAIISEENISALGKLKDQFASFAFLLRANLAPSIVIVMDATIRFIGKLREAAAFIGDSLLEIGLKKQLDTFGKASEAAKKGTPWAPDWATNTVGYWMSIFGSKTKNVPGALNLGSGMTEMNKAAEETAAQLKKLHEVPKPFKEGALDFTDVKTKQKSAESDSMVRFGNFLGTSQSAIVNMGQRQIQLQVQIARNTGRLVDFFATRDWMANDLTLNGAIVP